MNKTYLKHTLCLLLAAFISSWTLASCSKDEPVQQPIETYTISFQISTDGIFTRANEEDPWLPGHEDDESGNVFERTIASMDIFILGEDDALTRLYAAEDPTNQIGNKYLYTCKVSSDTPGVSIDKSTGTVTFSGKIMAIANAGVTESSWADADWKQHGLPYDMKFGEPGSWYIPMWGVQSYDGVELEADKITPLEKEIYLLRAVSKIIIELDESIRSDFEIQSISMAEESPLFLKQGFALPAGAFDVESTEKLDRELCFAHRVGANTITAPTFNGSAYSKYTYIAESKTDSEPFKFRVVLKSLRTDRPDITGYVYFSNYVSYEHKEPIYNVVRNHIYEFKIKLFELQFLTEVRKWEFDKKLHIDF